MYMSSVLITIQVHVNNRMTLKGPYLGFIAMLWQLKNEFERSVPEYQYEVMSTPE